MTHAPRDDGPLGDPLDIGGHLGHEAAAISTRPTAPSEDPNDAQLRMVCEGTDSERAGGLGVASGAVPRPSDIRSPEVSSKRCFTYCGDDRCTCDAHPDNGPLFNRSILGAQIVEAEVSRASTTAGGATFQARVQPWMDACFGREISMDREERGDRLLEEAFELLQSGGYDPARVLALRDYVWNRPAGEPSQEVGGVMVTLAAYCLAFGLDMHAAGETELARIWTKVDAIRAKQAAKPTGSALPVAPNTAREAAGCQHEWCLTALSTTAGERQGVRCGKCGSTREIISSAQIAPTSPARDDGAGLAELVARNSRRPVPDDTLISVSPPDELREAAGALLKHKDALRYPNAAGQLGVLDNEIEALRCAMAGKEGEK